MRGTELENDGTVALKADNKETVTGKEESFPTLNPGEPCLPSMMHTVRCDARYWHNTTAHGDSESETRARDSDYTLTMPGCTGPAPRTQT
eukprot:526150-Rhodomonas_salina.2